MEGPKLAAHQPAEFGVERAERLVHEEGHRLAHDRAAERDALAVAAGKARNRPVEDRRDPQDPRRFLDAAPDLGARHGLTAQRKGDVGAHVHVRIESKELEDKGDVALGGAFGGDLFRPQEDAASGRQFQPGDHPQGRRLATAGGTKQAEELAVAHGEVGAAHRSEGAEGFLEVLDSDLGHDRYRGNFETTMNITVPSSTVANE